MNIDVEQLTRRLLRGEILRLRWTSTGFPDSEDIDVTIARGDESEFVMAFTSWPLDGGGHMGQWEKRVYAAALASELAQFVAKNFVVLD